MERFFGSVEAAPKELTPFFKAIEDAYDGFDADRRETEGRLQHSISLLTATLESTAEGILVVDGHGSIRDFNRKFVSLWRIPDSLLESKDDGKLLAFAVNQLADPDAFLGRVQQLYSEPAAESSDVIFFKDGRVFERYSKPQSLGGRIVGRVWSFRDVTEQVRTQEKQNHLLQELENASHRLEIVNGELNDFAHVVSHDLKAPLRGIRTLADWITADCANRLSTEAQEQLRLMHSRVDRMQNLIDGILQYSRAGCAEEDRVRIDLKELVAEVVDTLSPPPNMEITIEAKLPVIELERIRVFQVFQNLLSNAIKYMDKPQGRIRVGCVEEGRFWKFSVSDNGPGIEERHFEKIFQLFQTLSRRDDRESTGIGLTLVKKIVEMYGGEVWVQSKLGEGSTFFFTLPRTQGKPQHEKLQAGTAC
jgi:signal transduction histidine kinase